MCFFIHPKHQEMKTAKRDITCYKSGFRTPDGNFRPMYQYSYKYFLGKLSGIIGWDLDKYSKQDMCDEIDVGFHSYSNKKELTRDSNVVSVVSVRCIIPKGAHYFYNPDDREYVSDQIIVQEFI